MGATLSSVQVSPSGNVLLVRFGSNVSAVTSGATLTVNGGSPITLTDPLWDSRSNSDLVFWPLGPTQSYTVIDDSTDSNATSTGSWVNKNNTNTVIDTGYVLLVNAQFHETTVPTDTATYTKTMPAAGRYLLRASGLVWLWGPDRTTEQTYTVSDGSGVVATFVVDMTAQPSWDWNDQFIRYHDLGYVTLRDTSLSVVVSNGSGSARWRSTACS